MIDLEQFKEIDSYDFRVRKNKDDSGDYTTYSYDILRHLEWGDNVIVYGIENPNIAIMFASTPLMIKEIQELRNENILLKNKIILTMRDLSE
jgi:hypothetical protein